jgi:hypothetical protein
MTALFYVMLYLRRIFFGFSKIINFILILATLSLFFLTHQYVMGSVFVILSFGIFMLRRCYDQILIKLNPMGNVLVLTD